MENAGLVTLFGNKANTQDQLMRLNNAEERYGPLERKYFGGLTRAIGLEFEVEGAHDHIAHNVAKQGCMFWHAETDGSLKDSGIELISYPIAGHNIDYALLEMEKILADVPAKASVRTSIHVHVDVSDFGVAELFSMVGMYALFEPAFFGMQTH